MAYTMNYAWWEDRRVLEQHDLESNYDMLMNRVQFRKTYKTANMTNWAIFTVDMEALRAGAVTPDFLDRYFRDVERHAPDYRHSDLAPTNRDLENPAVKNAWHEYLLIKKLATENFYELKNR